MADLELVSHALCPYVQRVAIALHEKGAAFRRRDVDLANKPAWFLAISPLGRTPLLRVDGAATIFESAVILEYLEDTCAPPLHPADALMRADHRGWIEFASSVLNDIAAYYNAPDEAALQAAGAALRRRFERVEARLAQRGGPGPWFGGARFGLVDAAFAPVFRYWDVFDAINAMDATDAMAPDALPPVASPFRGLQRVSAWRVALAARASVRQAVAPDYPQRLLDFLCKRKSALARRAERFAQERLPTR